MQGMDGANQMRELVTWLNEKARQYYVLDAPTVTDAEWDARYQQLLALERDTGTVLDDSPTRRVGGEPLSAFEPHRHLSRLWSMDKAQSENEVRDWAARAEKLRMQAVSRGEELPPLSFAIEHKFDGLTVNLTYRDGLLIQAATRGNGEVGEGILPQARTISSIPLQIPFRGVMEVHGEAYMTLTQFDRYNKTAPEPLKNPRNGAAGALRNLDPAVTRKRGLSACFYNVGYIEGKTLTDQRDMLSFLRENGFPVPDTERYADGIDGAMAAVRAIEESRGELDYMIDGAVIKIVDFRVRAALGYTEKFPRWAVAYKFEADEMTATLLDVTWDPGRTGKLTPLAHVSPVELAGATVTRATLNNYGDIRRKRVKLGAKVWIRRSNEVIPEIMGRVEEYVPGERDIEKPTACPACGAALVERGAHLFCPNRDGCVPQIVARLTHYASRDAMDIDTFSEKTAKQLHEALGVAEPSQLYALTPEQLCPLPRFGEKKALNLINALQKSKDCQLDQFIYALGIPNVGRKTARVLAERYGSMAALKEARIDELTTIRDVGAIVAGSVVEFFADAENQAQLHALTEAGVHPAWQARAAGGPLEGMTLVVTGTLPTLSRQEAEALIERAGGKAASSVSKKTHYVLVGENAGSKLQKAQALGVELLTEAEFLTKINVGSVGSMV